MVVCDGCGCNCYGICYGVGYVVNVVNGVGNAGRDVGDTERSYVESSRGAAIIPGMGWPEAPVNGSGASWEAI